MTSRGPSPSVCQLERTIGTCACTFLLKLIIHYCCYFNCAGDGDAILLCYILLAVAVIINEPAVNCSRDPSLNPRVQVLLLR